jgi:hypothetical protein
MHTNRKMVGSIIREVSPYKGDGSPLYRAEEIGEGTPEDTRRGVPMETRCLLLAARQPLASPNSIYNILECSLY